MPFLTQAEIKKVSTQRAIFTATVVASACHVRVDADGVGNNRLAFGTYRKSTGADACPRDFTLRGTETGATLPGCSAFLAGQIATLQFGNPGQLDADLVLGKTLAGELIPDDDQGVPVPPRKYYARRGHDTGRETERDREVTGDTL